MTAWSRISDDSDSTETEIAMIHAARAERAPNAAIARAIAVFGAAGASAPTASAAAHAGHAAVGAGAGSGVGTTGAAAGGVVALAKWVGAGVLAGVLTVGAAQRVAQHPTNDTKELSSRVARAGSAPASTQKVALGTPAAEPEAPRPPAPDIRGAPADPSAAGRAVGATPAARSFDHARVVSSTKDETPSPAISPTVNPIAAEAPAVEGSPMAGETAPGALIAEVASLDEARRALAANDPERADVLLRSHRATFAQGRMIDEATVLQIRVLLALGRRDAARDVSAQFLAQHPSTPYADRIRALLAKP